MARRKGEFVVPGQPRLEKGLDGRWRLILKKDEASLVQLETRNGFYLGEQIMFGYLGGSMRSGLSDWKNFRSENNSGPNNGGVNAYQKRREFIFSPEVGETIDGPQARYGVTPGEVDRVEAFGRGAVKITHLKLSPPRWNEKARILAMEFRCKFVWRQKPLEEITTDTMHSP